ncbi:DUF6338 family protein [Thalassotalea agariperforans]
MKITYETLNLLLLLIPGLLSSRIIQLMERKIDQNNLRIIVDVLMYSFLIYLAVEVLYKWSPIFTITKNNDGTFSYQSIADFTSVSITIILAIIFPITVGAIKHRDLHMLLLRAIRVTNKTSRETAWDDVFTNSNRYITVHFKDERRLTGWPMYYSNSPDEGFIYLYDAAWLDDNNNYIETNSHGILINKEDALLIEFLKHDKERQNEG